MFKTFNSSFYLGINTAGKEMPGGEEKKDTIRKKYSLAPKPHY